MVNDTLEESQVFVTKMYCWRVTLKRAIKIVNDVIIYAGATEQFLSRGSPNNKKNEFCEFLNFLLYKSPILGVARATPVPPPLRIMKNDHSIYQIFLEKNYFSKLIS